MPSLKDAIDFLEENWILICDNIFVFLLFGVLCVAGTCFVLNLFHKRTVDSLTKDKEEAINEKEHAKELLAEEQYKSMQLSQELSSEKKENERLREEYKKLSIEGKIVASREISEGVAAEKMSHHFQEKFL